SKNMPKQVVAKLSIESNQQVHGNEEPNPEVLHLLKERLAKGEITQNQYQNLKKVLEDKV
ncbi:MAG: SHOCT domain-containing protein, partial [Nitrosopumilaceae archaeon]